MAASEIIVVEGEKDADAVASLGLCATTSPMGAKKWKDIYNESLWGKHVVLIPDNDNEGREHMVQVAASLNGTAASLRILELPDLPSKGDFSDWLTKIGDKETAAERLALMIEQTALYDPPKRASFEDAILPETEFNIIELPTRKDILRPWLKEQSNSLVPGWRGVGKTWCAMGIVNAVTINEPFGPWDAGEPVPCLYLEGEMPAETVRERFRELRNDAERKAPLYIYSDAYANHLGLPRANLLNESWRKKMKSILLARHVKLWVIDNLASLASGIDENSKRDWDPINAWLLELRFAGIATIMLHHTNKMGSQRGTSAREDNIDSSILLRHPPDYTPEDGARFIATFKKARVHTEDLSLIADTEFQLTQDENNQFVWTWGSVKGQTKAEVLRMLDEGHPQNEVADILRIHKGTVSKIRKHAISDGLLTPKNKLTHRGFAMVSEDGD
jgi:hypothetical protein